jgi:predicted site-specific integrase-resolvase
MTNSLVVHQAQLPASLKKFRAAQYVRMSTDKQRYSIENQAAVIAAYAQTHDLSIVRTYRDEGESGLKLKNRKGLLQLLHDVSSNQADFTHMFPNETATISTRVRFGLTNCPSSKQWSRPILRRLAGV